jgi:hypothetical protein
MYCFKRRRIAGLDEKVISYVPSRYWQSEGLDMLVKVQKLTHVTGRLPNICANRDAGLTCRP